MLRSLSIIVLASASGLCFGQTYKAEIAYTQISGNTQYVYVANLDGTRAVRVATGVKNINGVDLSPLGGKLAFTDSQGLKIVSFTASNTGVQVHGVQLRVAAPYLSSADFTADGSGLLYHQGFVGATSAFQVVPVGAGPSVKICECAGMYPRWLAPSVDGDRFAFVRIFPSPTTYQLWSGLIAADGTVSIELELSTASQPFYEIGGFDVAHTRNAVLLSANYGDSLGPRIIEYNLDNDLVTQLGVRGVRVHYSAGDAKVIYITPHVAAGDYVSAFDTQTGVASRLTKKGSFGVTDARP